MGQFLSGFLLASLLWGAAGYLYVEGHLDAWLGPDETELAAAEASEAEPDDAAPKAGARKKRRGSKKRRRRRAPTGDAVTGDDIRWDDNGRAIDMQAGEAQLTGSQIEAGFDSVFPGIQRCLVLVPPDAPMRGKLVFGMRVAGSGRPTAVNLSGPAAITTGEAGSCLRRTAKSIHFASYDGPETVFRYPVELQ